MNCRYIYYVESSDAIDIKDSIDILYWYKENFSSFKRTKYIDSSRINQNSAIMEE